MTKQEEIREGIAEFLWKRGAKHTRFWPFSALEKVEKESPYLKGTRQAYLKKVDQLLSYLHSQGVVIKVERELPQCPSNRDDTVRLIWEEAQQAMLNAGFTATEPLIEEVKQ